MRQKTYRQRDTKKYKNRIKDRDDKLTAEREREHDKEREKYKKRSGPLKKKNWQTRRHDMWATFWRRQFRESNHKRTWGKVRGSQKKG